MREKREETFPCREEYLEELFRKMVRFLLF